MRRWVDGLSTAQRAVVVVAWAGVLWAISTWVFSDGIGYTFGGSGGWYNYAPNSGAVFSEGGPPWWLTNPTATMLVRFAFIAVWLVPSIWLLAARPAQELPDAADDADDAG